MSAEFCID